MHWWDRMESILSVDDDMSDKDFCTVFIVFSISLELDKCLKQ
jgi:hypothetical protein